MRKDKSALSIAVVVVIAAAIVGCIVDTPTSDLLDGVQVSQCWIGAVIGAGVNVLGGIGSALAANQQVKKAREHMDIGQSKLDDWYTMNMNTDILDRADSRSMLNAYRDAMDEQNRKYAQNAIKGGASEEAKVAYAQAQNKGYADAISQITAQGQRQKDLVSQLYMQGKMDYHNQLANMYQQSGKAMGNALSQAASGIGSAVNGLTLEDFKKK